MLLQKLKQYADERMAGMAPPSYAETSVRYLIELDLDGRPARRMIDTADPKNPRTKRGQRRQAPQVVRGVNIVPFPFADTGEFTFGIGSEKKNPQRVARCHAAYRAMVQKMAAELNEPAVQAVARFYEQDGPAQIELPEDFDPSMVIAFRVDDGGAGVLPIDLPAVQAYWARLHDPEAAGAPVMQCVVCGQRRPVKRTLDKIKGVPRGQMGGTSIISANADAFESYGLEQSLIAPTCADCGDRFTKAANTLLAGEGSALRVSDAAVCIYWTREPVGFDLFRPLTSPEPEQVRELLASARTGAPRLAVDDTAFYAAVLSGSGGRTVVRDWLDTTVGEVRMALALWFTRQMIIDDDGQEPRSFGLTSLAGATVRELRDIDPQTPRSLLHSAFTGTALPFSLLALAVGRIRAEQRITQPRAALIKAVLAGRQTEVKEEWMVRLDRGTDDPAYGCGRLLAILEDIQRAAIPGINATVVDRFFGTASSAPLSVFSRLVKGAQPHLAKLRRDRPGAHRALEARLTEVLAGMDGFPRVMTLEQQGRFALGYYHQRAHDRAERIAAAERRRQGKATTEDIDQSDVAAAQTATEEQAKV